MSKPNRLLTAAYSYADRGWPVFPLVRLGKTPYGSTNGHKDATTNKSKLLDWWGTTREANIGLRTGIESGLFVLDVDPRHGGNESLKRLSDEHGPLPETLTVATGGGGQHFYFLHPGKGFKVTSRPLPDYVGLDVKGDGGYVVAPPSVHETGAVYEFENSHDVAVAPEWLLGLVARRATETTETTEDMSLVVSVVSVASLKDLDDAIRVTVPNRVGVRHRQIFQFARALQALPEYKDRQPTELKAEFLQWFEACRDVMMTAGNVMPFESAFEDFIEGWPKVLKPMGCDILGEAFERANVAADPPECADLESDEAKLLAKFCRELQRHAGDCPFFLSCDKVRQFLRLANNPAASGLLQSLVRAGILEVVKKGTQGLNGKATRWRYLPPLDGDAQNQQTKEKN